MTKTTFSDNEIKNGFSKNWNFSISPEFKKLIGNIEIPKMDNKVKVTYQSKTPEYFYKMRSQKGFMILGYKSINGARN